MMLRKLGRVALACVATVAMGLGMTSCGGGTVGYMWVLGSKYNQIAGFKIDNNTGNLTATVGSPYTSGGANPTMIVVKPGGRYVYVLNSGTPTTAQDPNNPLTYKVTTDTSKANITLFSVGGDGTLTPQLNFGSQGFNPTYIATDPGGGILYVLDAVSPNAVNGGCLLITSNPTHDTSKCFGDITVYTLNVDTGRPTLIQNQQVKVAGSGAQQTFFDVGLAPTMMRLAGSGCLYTLDSGDQSIYPYTINTSSAQLTTGIGSTLQTTAQRLTYLGGSASFMYATDAGANQILAFGLGGANCALQPVTGGTINNLNLTVNPVYTFADSKGKYLYVLNEIGTNPNNAVSSISAFVIETNGQLQGIAGAPFSVGAGPVCMVEDPTNQYVYTSNSLDGTVSGKIINQNTGELSQLSRAAAFTAFSAGGSSCMAVSGSI